MCGFLGFQIFGRMKIYMSKNKIGHASHSVFPLIVPIGEHVPAVGLSDSSRHSTRQGRGG